MKILIIEDDQILAKTIQQVIAKEYDSDIAYDGEEGLLFAQNGIYDAILLDIMLPRINGYDVLKNLRKNKIYTPVLILTAKDGIDDKIEGFNSGADDYLTKPFENKELLARLKAIIRRKNGDYAEENTIKFKGLKLDLNSREVTAKGEQLNLQGKQFDVLEYLLNSKNTIITKDQIFDKIWGFDSETYTNVVEVYASGLRKELKKVGFDKYFKTIRGVGYIWDEKAK